MKYFLHDTNSFDDEKVSELFIKFGYEGVGLFYTALEKIARQEKPIKTEILKSQLRVGKRLNRCWVFMEEIGLIQSRNGETFNKELLNFSEKYQIKKEKNRKKISEWREKQGDTKNVTGYVPSCNPPKVKESKVNKYRDNVFLREKDYNTLVAKYGSWTEKLLDKYHYWKLNKGTDYKGKSDYGSINSWVVKALRQDEPDFDAYLKKVEKRKQMSNINKLIPTDEDDS